VVRHSLAFSAEPARPGVTARRGAVGSDSLRQESKPDGEDVKQLSSREPGAGTADVTAGKGSADVGPEQRESRLRDPGPKSMNRARK
jgi:hypothetical protein